MRTSRTLAALGGAGPRIARLSRKVTTVLAAVLLAGCGGGAADDAPAPIEADTLVVYSSLPRTGDAAVAGRAVAAGQRLALADAGGRVGRHRVRLVELDSAEPDERDWDPDRVEENADRAAEDPAAIAYLGELDLGASAVSVPVTNEESILQVSPGDGLATLTLPQTGPGATPERFYPAEVRSFFRLVPPDSAQAGALAAVARSRGARRVVLAHDGGIFGRQLAGGVEQAAADQGLTVTGVERVQPDLDERAALGQRLERDNPDAVIYQGIGGEAAMTLLAAMAEGVLASRPLVAASPLAEPGALPAGEPERPLRVVSPLLPARQYPPAGRRVLARLAAENGSARVAALYGYESMRVVLQALRAAGRRAADRLAVIEAARTSGPRGSVIGRYRFDDRGDSSRRRLALYELWRGRLRYRGPAPGSGR
jgi:branched-chain amino acid transport system substrate-binding protein